MPTAEAAPLHPVPLMASPASSPSSLLKRAMRPGAVERRRLAHRRLADAAAGRIRDAFLSRLRPPPGTVVAAYWPMGDEADVRPLIAALHGGGCVVALPVVAARGQPLEFRGWRPGERLEPGVFGTLHPAAAAPTLRPSLVLVPLLAFDRRGHRLGYGGGYYDRTLEALRRAASVTAIGVAYAAQEIAAVPHDGHDQRLDLVLTEEGILDTGGTVE